MATIAIPNAASASSSSLGLYAKRFVNALVASRFRALELEMRRHDAVIRDLSARYGHTPVTLSEAELLPFKL